MAKQNQKQKYRRQKAGSEAVPVANDVKETPNPSTSTSILSDITSNVTSSISSLFAKQKDDLVVDTVVEEEVKNTLVEKDATAVGNQDGGKKHKKSSKKSKSKKSRAKKHKKSVKR
jgi:hypothetical protein